MKQDYHTKNVTQYHLNGQVPSVKLHSRRRSNSALLGEGKGVFFEKVIEVTL